MFFLSIHMYNTQTTLGLKQQTSVAKFIGLFFFCLPFIFYRFFFFHSCFIYFYLFVAVACCSRHRHRFQLFQLSSTVVDYPYAPFFVKHSYCIVDRCTDTHTIQFSCRWLALLFITFHFIFIFRFFFFLFSPASNVYEIQFKIVCGTCMYYFMLCYVGLASETLFCCFSLIELRLPLC